MALFTEAFYRRLRCCLRGCFAYLHYSLAASASVILMPNFFFLLRAEFLRYSVPFLTRCAGLLIKGGSAELAKNDVSLAREAREIMEALGPTYVKLGQVLSVRPDILPPAALKELTILQDSVKKFPTSVALEVIEAELGGPVENFFVDMTPEPVAAASLAQVYRATIAPGHEGAGTEVAVKVQRPDVLELVSKDLYVLRRAAEVYQGLVDRFAPQQRTNWVALLNEWAVGFCEFVRFCLVVEISHYSR